MPEASSGSTPPCCLGNPTPKAGDLQKPGLGAQPALPSWAQPGFGPAHHSSGVLSPHLRDQKLLSTGLRRSPHAPWHRPTHGPMLRPRPHLQHTPIPSRSPGKVRPGQCKPEGAGGLGPLFRNTGWPRAWGGSRPGLADGGVRGELLSTSCRTLCSSHPPRPADSHREVASRTQVCQGEGRRSLPCSAGWQAGRAHPSDLDTGAGRHTSRL